MGAARAGLGVLAAALGCVRVDLAPNGIASARLVPTPPAIAHGDVLRDSTGAPTTIRVVAYDASGDVVTTVDPRFVYVPANQNPTGNGGSPTPTTPGAGTDSALVVDSLTGAVRSTTQRTGPWAASRGLVAVRLGNRLQLLDTLAIVPPPNAIVATDTTRTLRYDCTDYTPTAVQGASGAPDTAFVNTVGPFSLVVRGDSAGVSRPVPRWLVRWSIDSVSVNGTPVMAPIPTAKRSDSTTVPAIAVISTMADRVLTYDTTDASGTSSVRLRIRPTALGKTYIPDTIFRVTLRADVITGPGRAVPGSPSRGAFAVTLKRQSAITASANAACRR